jgi:nicotinamide phosphoribosyltransferase
MNNILLSDAYKYSHHRFYHPGTTSIYSYLESRGGQFDETVFYGLQYFLKNYLSKPFTRADIEEAREVLHGVFGREDVFEPRLFEYILEKHGGYFPVRIKAVPEGTVVPVKNVLMSIENTDEHCPWATNFLETLLLQVWYPITVATLSREVRRVIRMYLAKNSDNRFDQFMLNDFGFRGVSSVESAGLGGSAHLVNFQGSDTLAASAFIRQYYNTRTVYGLSIPATEHSICTQQGEAQELEVFRRVLATFPEGMVACVSDSYDIFRACREYWGDALKTDLLQRKGTLVIRPDSGDPVRTLLEVFGILFERFGATQNSKGYRVLPPQVRVIQGDGVHLDSIRHILEVLDQHKIAAENLVFGMGGKLLQGVHRDTLNFAFKCSHTVIEGQGYGVAKNPLEMDADGQIHPSFKKSKKGRLSLHRHRSSGAWHTQSSLDPMPEGLGPDLLAPVFENGRILQEWTFEEIREKADGMMSDE